MKKENKKLSLDNFTVAELKESDKVQGGDGGGDTIIIKVQSKGCFPPKR